MRMKKVLLTFALMFAVTGISFAQGEGQAKENENIKTHQVYTGETVIMIAKKYSITPRDIYDYNPDAVNGLTPNGILRIPLHRQVQFASEEKPVKNTGTPAKAKSTGYSDEMYGEAPVREPEKKETAVVTTPAAPAAPKAIIVSSSSLQTFQHTVKSGETLYSLARRYNTSVRSIQDENADKLASGLETGTVLNITTKPRVGDPEKYIAHDVAAGETLFSLAKKYNTTVAAITEGNKDLLKKGLMSGQRLMILPGDISDNGGGMIAKADIDTGTIAHKVENGETLNTIANKYHTTVEDITAINKNELSSGLKPGQVLNIKNNTAISTVTE